MGAETAGVGAATGAERGAVTGDAGGAERRGRRRAAANFAASARGSPSRTTSRSWRTAAIASRAFASLCAVAMAPIFSLTSAASVALGMPLAAFADGANSQQTVLRARGIYGSRIFALQGKSAGDIVEEKNAFTLFLSGAYRAPRRSGTRPVSRSAGTDAQPST